MSTTHVPPLTRPQAIEALLRRRRLVHELGGPRAVERQRARGLLTPHERVSLLLDPGTDLPFGPLVHSDNLPDAEQPLGDGELAGFGTIDGRPIACLCSDPRVKGATGGPGSFRHSEAFRHIVVELEVAVPLVPGNRAHPAAPAPEPQGQGPRIATAHAAAPGTVVS